MLPVVDFIETQDVAKSKAVWTVACNFFSVQQGFVKGRLLETFHTLHPRQQIALTSVCLWRDEDSWQAARSAAKGNPALMDALGSLPATFARFDCDLFQGSEWGREKGQPDNMVLVDVVYLPPERMAAYAQMWGNARRYMEENAGYVSASLYRSRDLAKPVKYLNLAEWQTPELFFAALSTPQFLDIIGEFKDDFSLYLSRKSVEILPNRHKELEKVV